MRPSQVPDNNKCWACRQKVRPTSGTAGGYMVMPYKVGAPVKQFCSIVCLRTWANMDRLAAAIRQKSITDGVAVPI